MLNKMVNMHRTCLLLALLEVISKNTNTDYCAKAPFKETRLTRQDLYWRLQSHIQSYTVKFCLENIHSRPFVM